MSRTRGPQKKQVSYRAARRIQSGAEHLVHVHERLHAFGLSNNLGAQRRFKITRIRAAYGGIQLLSNGGFHHPWPSSRLVPPDAATVSSIANLCDMHGKCQSSIWASCT